MGAEATDLAELSSRGLLSGITAPERMLPVLPVLGQLLPHGMQRGSVIGCEASTDVSLALTLAAGPSREGAWVGVAGLPDVGIAAAIELGVVPERLVLIAEPPTGFDDARWGEVLAAMIDGFDVLLLGPGVQCVRAGTARRLAARLAARGAVAITVGCSAFGADVSVRSARTEWHGLGEGYGVARSRLARVEISGRRVPRPRSSEMWLPSAAGQVEPFTIEQGTNERGTVVPLRPTG